MDMATLITPRSDQINADDLQGGRTITVTVTEVLIKGGQEQPISIRLAETDKFYRPCKSMCRVLAQAWGLDSSQYAGRSMTLYTDPTVKFGPLAVGGIRISHMSHIDGPMVMALTATKGVKKSFKVLQLEMQKPADVFTVEQAELELRTAKTLDDLKTAWTRKQMAPHRSALQTVLDELKAALAPPPIEPDPVVTDAKENEIIAAIDASTDIDALGNVMSDHRADIAQLGEDASNRIWAANNKRKFQFREARA